MDLGVREYANPGRLDRAQAQAAVDNGA